MMTNNTTTPYVKATGQSASIPTVVVQGQFVSNNSDGLQQVATSSSTSYSYYYDQNLIHHGGGTDKNHNGYHDHHRHGDDFYPSPPPSWTRGERQPNSCRDVVWAILFYVQLGGIATLSIMYVPMMVKDTAAAAAAAANNGRRLLFLPSSSYRSLQEEQDDGLGDDDYDYSNGGGGGGDLNVHDDLTGLFVVIVVSAVVGLIVSTIAMSLLMAYPRTLIKTALCINIIVAAGFVILSLQSGIFSIMAILGFLLTAYYAYVVWSRIPFAAANLKTAIAAVQSNMGLAFFAYNNLILIVLWSLWWLCAFSATNYVLSNCNAEGYCENDLNGFFIFTLLISYFWTAQVIKNVVHVTVAGTVGTWWFHPQEANNCCSQGVRDSYWRSITTSFGSICLGSLIVGIVQAIRHVVHSMRSDDDGLLLCLADCLVSCLESLVKYFNKWAYIYVGLYGYSFIEASKNVFTLFQNRGWTAIIADNLVDTVLAMVCVCVGLLTGIIGLAIGLVTWPEEGDESIMGLVIAIMTVVGMVIGYIACNTLFSLISSGVNTVIVCFAEAPGEFQVNHPQLASEMIQSWREAYPHEFGY